MAQIAYPRVTMKCYRVDGCYLVKVADFGMSRDVYDKDYYRMESMDKPLPIKWMAPESMVEGRYTAKSDVVGSFSSS